MLNMLAVMQTGLAGIVGAVVGSFGATAALRLSAGTQAWSGRSQCDECQRTLSWANTVPIAGYIAAKGRCSKCGGQIDRFHLVGEVLGAITASLAIVAAPNVSGLLVGLTGLVLLVQALIDIRNLRLPDIGNLCVAVLCVVIALLNSRLIEGLIAAVIAIAILVALKTWMEWRQDRTVLGLGDVKLIAALSLGLGQWTPAMVAVSSILALGAVLIFKKDRDAKLPFGPAIAFSGFAFLLGLTVWGGAG